MLKRLFITAVTFATFAALWGAAPAWAAAEWAPTCESPPCLDPLLQDEEETKRYVEGFPFADYELHRVSRPPWSCPLTGWFHCLSIWWDTPHIGRFWIEPPPRDLIKETLAGGLVWEPHVVRNLQEHVDANPSEMTREPVTEVPQDETGEEDSTGKGPLPTPVTQTLQGGTTVIGTQTVNERTVYLVYPGLQTEIFSGIDERTISVEETTELTTEVTTEFMATDPSEVSEMEAEEDEQDEEECDTLDKIRNFIARTTWRTSTASCSAVYDTSGSLTAVIGRVSVTSSIAVACPTSIQVIIAAAPFQELVPVTLNFSKGASSANASFRLTGVPVRPLLPLGRFQIIVQRLTILSLFSLTDEVAFHPGVYCEVEIE